MVNHGWARVCGVLVLVAACNNGSTATSLAQSPSIVLESDLGGEGTVESSGTSAFGLPSPALDPDSRPLFVAGDALFTDVWSPNGVGPEDRQGLGPTFMTDSCSSCHVRDGRASPPSGGAEDIVGLVVAVQAEDSSAHAVYGSRLQTNAVEGVLREARVEVAYDEIEGHYGDGATYTLLAPSFTLVDLAFGALEPGVRTSARLAPPVFGAGLLEAIKNEGILRLADPNDSDGDGISGRANLVRDLETGDVVLGRFGWKAGQASVRNQTAAAASEDLGVTSSLLPEANCPQAQTECSAAAAVDKGGAELTDEQLDLLTFYVQTLGVPAMRNVDDPVVHEGAQVFVDIACASCHTPTHITGDHELAHLTGQTIHPYTDLLLHDMGQGLADGFTEFEASGSEWRTPPLWGIGLTETVNGHTRFLHDGRARGIAEAILWHGGEAEASKESFRSLPARLRDALIAFLKAL